ncbi:MAG: DUF6109 family natural product biosynthesis protein, partial [Pseudomonadota bacterium]
MSRRDKAQSSQERRVCHDLEKGLTRGDVELALSSLLLLPASSRDEYLAAVSRLVLGTIREDKRGRKWDRIMRLA